jgi:hypothetical protein
MRRMFCVLFAGLACMLIADQIAPAQQKGEQKKGQPDLPDLVAALKASPGCLGVDTAATTSGKQVIFAWFEDKKAVLKWYYGDVHKQVMKQLAPGITNPNPLKEVAEESGPIMVVASVTLAKEGKFKQVKLPITQIAIELYQPLPGGAYLGGRFAPASVKVPHLRDYTPKEKEKE